MNKPTGVTIHLKFADRYRQSEVKRWHIVETSRNQTLAEHCYNVMLIANELYNLLAPSDEIIDQSSLLLGLVAHHDEHEVIMGDRPTCAKKNGDSATHQSYMFENLAETAPEWLLEIVKLADSIEAYWFIREYGIGRYARKTTVELQSRCLEEVLKYRYARGINLETAHYIKNIILEGPEGFDMTPEELHVKYTH